MSKRYFDHTSESDLRKKLRKECRKRVREGDDDWNSTDDLSTKKRLILEDRDVTNPSKEDDLQLLSSMESEEYQQFMEKLENEILHELNTQFTQRDNLERTVLCPLCHDAFLVFHSGMICCPNCQYGIVDRGHGWTMETIRNTLASAYEDHQRLNSTVPLKFKIDTSASKAYLCSSCAFTSTYQLSIFGNEDLRTLNGELNVQRCLNSQTVLM